MAEKDQKRYNRQYKQKHRWDGLRGVRFRLQRPFKLLTVCLPEHHFRTGHMSMIAAMSVLPSKRCKWCNLLIPNNRQGASK
jgi:hypothetical protein